MNEFDKIKYNNNYNKDNYKIISFRVKKSTYDQASEIAKEKGYSTINSYAKSLFENDFDKTKTSISQKIEIKGNANNITTNGNININN